MATTVKVERDVANELENLKKKLGLRSINSVIEYLIKEYKMRKLNHVFGVDRDKINSFSEEDRIEDRY
jgi:hypothetical protein